MKRCVVAKSCKKKQVNASSTMLTDTQVKLGRDFYNALQQVMDVMDQIEFDADETTGDYAEFMYDNPRFYDEVLDQMQYLKSLID